MKRVSSILAASLFALGAAVPAFAHTHAATSTANGTKVVAAGVHKTAVVSDDDSSGGSPQPDQPQQPSGSDDGE